jgi:hypothetical protein
MVVMNTSDKNKTVDLDRYTERTNGFSKAKNIVTDATNELSGSWQVPGKTIWILELEK